MQINKRFGGLFLLLAGALSTFAQPASAAGSLGEKTVLYVRIDFSDDPGDPITQSAAQDFMDHQVSPFYAAESYGKTWLNTTVTPLLRMLQTKAWYDTNRHSPLADALTAAAAAGYVPPTFAFRVIAHRWIGFLGVSSTVGTNIELNGEFDFLYTPHELGHAYGLPHANAWIGGADSIIGPGFAAEYGNRYDIMGAGSTSADHFNAAFKYRLGWFDAPEVQTVTAGGTFRVYALEETIPAGALHALRIPNPGWGNYWIEFRPGGGPPAFSNGVSINGVYADFSGQSLLFNMNFRGSPRDFTASPLLVGQTFSDGEQGIHITVLGLGGATPESMDVAVKFGSFPGNGAPTLFLTPSTLNTNPGTPVTVSATATDPDGDALACHWDFGEPGSWGPNAPVVEKSWPNANDYRVRCTVSDMKGGTGFGQHRGARGQSPGSPRERPRHAGRTACGGRLCGRLPAG